MAYIPSPYRAALVSRNTLYLRQAAARVKATAIQPQAVQPRPKPKSKPRPAPTNVVPRPLHERLTTVPGQIVRLALPPGSFNAGLATLPGTDQYVCVYRPDEHRFAACLLDHQLTVMKGSEFELGVSNCADPRLIWVGDRLVMIYSSLDKSTKTEVVYGGVIMEADRRFIQPETHMVSLPGAGRQKNWMPFVYDGSIHLIASVRPHRIYTLCLGTRLVSETAWAHPWFNDEFMRGNTNPVQLEDGTWLGTFHTVVKQEHTHYYDNGCYVFEGHPPFKVLRCANRTYLSGEAAVEPYVRKAGLIKVCFPAGMVREGNRLLISYGDNDSCCKVLETTVQDMLDTTITRGQPHACKPAHSHSQPGQLSGRTGADQLLPGPEHQPDGADAGRQPF